MNRLLQMLLLTVLFVAYAPLTLAQPAGAKAYAPEQLSQLSARDQTRVIELEYSEQSGGRRLPDDQLRFYLDQVRLSNWSFSQIKADIAQSLRGGTGVRPPAGVGGQVDVREVICESRRNRLQECALPRRGDAQLVRQLSSNACVRDHTWGQRGQTVWVSRGCRAVFEVRRGGGRPDAVYSVTCTSDRGRRQTCAWELARHGRPRLIEQLTRAECREGSTWGYSPRDGLWVDRGCQARFGPR